MLTCTCRNQALYFKAQLICRYSERAGHKLEKLCITSQFMAWAYSVSQSILTFKLTGFLPSNRNFLRVQYHAFHSPLSVNDAKHHIPIHMI
jgi:hypothetical protein